MVRIVVLVLAALLLAFPASAQKRVALVIGNSAYQHTGKLANPKNDATDVAAALKALGFEIVGGFDLDKATFDRKVRDFAAALKGSDAGVFFYAGHGLQVAGQNYLVPIDAKAEEAEALDFEMVRVDVIHRIMERQTNTNILFLDACRDNPLARNLARSMGTRSSEVGRGLAQVEAGVGTLISFSTQPGNVALDGTGRNSPFAGALVRHLTSTDNDLSAILIAVRNDVMRETQRKQVPWEHSALTGRFHFNLPAQTAEPTKAAPARLSDAAEAWDRTKDTTTIAEFELFIARYKDSYYAELARLRVEELKKKQQVVIARPPITSSDPAANITKGWSELGCQQVSLQGDRGNIRLGRRSERFRAVRLHVRGNDLEVQDVRLIYTHEYEEGIPVRQLIRSGDRTRQLDLGGKLPIESVNVFYRPVQNFSGTASVCIEGLQ